MKISRREKEVLHLIAQEYTTCEIARQLFISAHTVVSHRKNLLHKLQARNVAGLVRRGFERGLLSASTSLLAILFVLTSLFTGNIIAQTTVEPDYILTGRDQLPNNGEAISDTFILMDASKGAMRGGTLQNAPFWSPDSIAPYSFSWGFNTLAIGNFGSTSLGYNTRASGEYGATATGFETRATGDYGATALGYETVASGEDGATAIGNQTIASGQYGATALGYRTTATGDRGSTSMGYQTLLPVFAEQPH